MITMFELKEKTGNRKQFHYLVSKFLMEKILMKKFYDASLEFKLNSIAFHDIHKKYKFSKNDKVSEHLYKCIDIYCNERELATGRLYIDELYSHTIKGFFRLVPCTFDKEWYFWERISDEWERKTRNIKFDYGDNRK